MKRKEKRIKNYKLFEAELKSAPSKAQPGVKPGVTPGVKPVVPSKSPIRRDRPLVKPAPKATAEDVVERFAKLTNQYGKKK